MKTTENWHSRHALMIASDLPDNIEDARAVLRLVSEIVEGFFAKPEQRDTDRTNVVTLDGRRA
jgi:hypothetical protein